MIIFSSNLSNFEIGPKDYLCHFTSKTNSRIQFKVVERDM